MDEIKALIVTHREFERSLFYFKEAYAQAVQRFVSVSLSPDYDECYARGLTAALNALGVQITRMSTSESRKRRKPA